LNLNSIIQGRRDFILARLSDAIGRPVTVESVEAHLGWGVSIDLSGVQVAGDPAASPLPLLQAQDLFLTVDFVPLLFREVRVTELRLTHPALHLIRDREGILNLDTVMRESAARHKHAARAASGITSGQAPNLGEPLEAAPASGPHPFNALSIHKFALEDGVIDYLDQSTGAPPVEFNHVAISVANFSFRSRFDLDVTLAAFGDQKNLEVTGQAGPLVRNNGLDLHAIPLHLTATAGPLTFAQLRLLPTFAHTFPPLLIVNGPLNLTATASGAIDAINFTTNVDLTPNEVIWQPHFIKPSGTAMTVAADGARTADRMVLDAADLVLASVKAHFTQVELAPGHLAANIATNDFDAAPLAALLPAANQYHPNGAASIHGTVTIGADHHPKLDGTVKLSRIALSIPESSGGSASITQLNGPIRFAGNGAQFGPLTFNLGSARVHFEARAQSLQPPRISYDLSANRLAVADFVPSRSNDGPEYLANLTANGTAAEGDNRAASINLDAGSGLINNVPFTNLALAAGYTGDNATINSLALNTCDGTVSASGLATLGERPTFDLNLSTRGLNLQKALADLKAKAANTVRGLLDADLELAGRGPDFEHIRPTLRGSGKAQVTAAKLVGVNVAAQALRKIDHLPAIGSLVPGDVVANHPELFASPDTDIQTASLTFVIFGQRLTTHDFFAQAADYNATASGWFDLDKDLDMNTKIILSQPFSSELIAARKNAAFLANRDGQIIIPLRITGRLPKPQVLPNIDQLAQLAAGNAVRTNLGGLLNKGGKGLGGLFHGKNPLQGLFR
ncbi:MAG: AsmA-like C-terminal region-containing protein, partial [Candidatus Binataceae bacterium]